MPNSIVSPTPQSQDVMFPAFIVGDKSSCRRKLKAEAKKWAKAYLAGREFPEPKLVPVPPGTIVFTEDSMADLFALGYNFIPNTNMVIVDGEAARQENRHIQCRAFTFFDMEDETGSAAAQERTVAEGEAFRRAFRTFVCKYAWGALAMAIRTGLHSSVASTIPRIDAVLCHWETLDTLRYIDVHPAPISFSQLLHLCFRGNVAMWVDQPTGDIRVDLQTAVEQMRQASADEIHARLVRCLRELVDSEQRLKNRDWVRSPGVIEEGLEKKLQQGQHKYDKLTGGQEGELGGFLFGLERAYGPDSEKYDPSFGAKT